jgi:hypothetical protein
MVSGGLPRASSLLLVQTEGSLTIAPGMTAMVHPLCSPGMAMVRPQGSPRPTPVQP